MDRLVEALGPVFAAGFAVQQLLEILSPVLDRIKWNKNKKEFLGITSLVLGLVLSWAAGLKVLQAFGLYRAGFIDVLVSGLIISAGTEGTNSIIKFLGYAKERKKAQIQG
ncbi:MAG: hypothetical protein LHV69_07810 [Elusimicrobia bacterium]|nr:hypothetical protein [Candidatus Obscuribacterium magneticum]